MDIITKKQRYLPHTLETRFYAVKLYRGGHSVAFVCRRYKISKSSLMRWNKRFDGTKGSLLDHSHRPHTKHPNSHTDEELQHIKNYHRRNPAITLLELYAKMKFGKGYRRHPVSLYRVLRKLGIINEKVKHKKPYTAKPYDTPDKLGVKWQLDVKYVPKACYTGQIPDKFYQYTVIDEASRERFIYPFREQTSHTTILFVQMAIKHFGYHPEIIQTDNGAEFTHLVKTNRIHPFDLFCNERGIKHQLIRPRTPRHNGKVERSHRNDNERFYSRMNFYSYEDLKTQMKRYLRRSNNTPMQTLNWRTPMEQRKLLEGVLAPLQKTKVAYHTRCFF